jgi:alcohol dehydrogenase (NADP+)
VGRDNTQGLFNHRIRSFNVLAIYLQGKGHDDCAGYHTNGGYSSDITVRRDFVFKVPEGMGMEYVGPLLCAGITMFSPLNRHVLMKEDGKHKSVGIVGFGGLGQMGVKLAKAMGCSVTVLSRSTSKKAEAEKLGAVILAHSDAAALKEALYSFDLIIDTASVHHEIAPILTTLKVGGTYVCIGGIAQPVSISPFGLIANYHKIEGSFVGGIPETQKMLDFCSEHNVLPEIKVISARDATDQFKALADGSAGALRAVIDITTLADLPDRD